MLSSELKSGQDSKKSRPKGSRTGNSALNPITELDSCRRMATSVVGPSALCLAAVASAGSHTLLSTVAAASPRGWVFFYHQPCQGVSWPPLLFSFAMLNSKPAVQECDRAPVMGLCRGASQAYHGGMENWQVSSVTHTFCLATKGGMRQGGMSFSYCTRRTVVLCCKVVLVAPSLGMSKYTCLVEGRNKGKITFSQPEGSQVFTDAEFSLSHSGGWAGRS